ncbi:DUF2726 domain-containing protein [Gimibacter soli]|uniref:DUF2726 domain-containing protein n=1 Tax=Gimibacter soli TaxID=3024400 RepID=A0AAE9XNB3_9PROT|nr:DUF2726 domain-containing protein [Gimibacter soli]WCL53197.1 DUF2726 domain-containing protein [Gimibacter soli]
MDVMVWELVGLGLILVAILGLNGKALTRRKGSRPKLVYSRERQAERRDPTIDQLQKVMQASFTKRRIMNGSEYGLFRLVEKELPQINGGYRVFAQTCLGEIIGSKDSEAHACINSKRVDILIIGNTGEPLAAIEYQGSGHYQGNAAVRDAVKKEALRRAGVRYVEIFESYTDETVRQLLRDALRPAPQTAATSPAA